MYRNKHLINNILIFHFVKCKILEFDSVVYLQISKIDFFFSKRLKYSGTQINMEADISIRATIITQGHFFFLEAKHNNSKIIYLYLCISTLPLLTA